MSSFAMGARPKVRHLYSRVCVRQQRPKPYAPCILIAAVDGEGGQGA